MLVAGLAAGAWWLLGKDPDHAPLGGDGDDAIARSPPEPARAAPTTARPSPAPSEDVAAEPVAAEAVARPDERLPLRRKPEGPPIVPVSQDLLRSGERTISGEVLLSALVSARLAPVRWDTEATRSRFLRAKFRTPQPRPSPDGTFGVLLFEVAVVIGADEQFSARLDDRALYIGAKGVYEPAPSPR